MIGEEREEVGLSDVEKRVTAALAKIESAAAIALLPNDPIEWDIELILPCDDAPALMFAAPGTLKTWIALRMCDAVTRGIPFAGLRTRKRPSALYVNLDTGPKSFRRRVRKVSDLANFEVVTLSRSEFSLDVLDALLERHRGGFVVIDAFAAIFAPERWVDPTLAMRAFVDDLRARFARYDCGGVVIDHAHRPKAIGRDRTADPGDYYGDVQKHATFRAMWSVASEPPDTKNSTLRRVVLKCRKVSEGREFEPIVLDVEFGDFVTIRRGNVLEMSSPLSIARDNIVAFARAQTETFTQTGVVDSPLVKGNRTNNISTFKALVDEGVFEVAQRAGRIVRYRVASRSSAVPELPGTIGTSSSPGVVPIVLPPLGGNYEPGTTGNDSESDDGSWAVDSETWAIEETL